MDIMKADDRESRAASAEYFTGRVWQDPVIEAPEPARVRALKVTFEPGARTAWHTHPLGQTLHVLSGLGLVGLRGKAPRVIRRVYSCCGLVASRGPRFRAARQAAIAPTPAAKGSSVMVRAEPSVSSRP